MLAVIAAYAENRVIGQNGCIPWDILEEKHRFRDITMGHTLLMGRRTYEEIGRPLPGRETIVLSQTGTFDAPHCTTVSNWAQVWRTAGEDTLFVCGGEAIYRQALPLADVLYLTEIHAQFAGDRFFPAIHDSDYDEIERTEILGDIPYTFRTLRRKKLSYIDSRNWIRALTAQKGIILGLQPLRELLCRMGCPQDSCPAVHIAGTNGKGSTLAMTASILQQAGYRVGTYSSPAVFDERECWRVNGESITQEQYADGMSKIYAVCQQMQAEKQPLPTAFELETALAFWHFAQQQCDIMVIECGMGGQDDATNVLRTTAVSILTAIGMEHMRFLGNTIQEIAQNKAGILRKAVPAVIQSQDETVLAAVRQRAVEIGSLLSISQPSQVTAMSDGIAFTCDGAQYTTALTARYQADNAAAAVTAVKLLKQFPVSDDAIVRGLRAVTWHGRMEQISSQPIIVMDGAHNPNAAVRLREEVQRRWGDKKIIELIGVLADKDFTQVGQLMAPLAQRIITVTPPNNPRALDAHDLAQCLSALHPCVTAADSISEAVRLALEAAGQDGILLAFGSLSWLNAFKQAVEAQT